jgi:hypothetical protein
MNVTLVENIQQLDLIGWKIVFDKRKIAPMLDSLMLTTASDHSYPMQTTPCVLNTSTSSHFGDFLALTSNWESIIKF